MALIGGARLRDFPRLHGHHSVFRLAGDVHRRGLGTIWAWYLRRHLPGTSRCLERVGKTEEAEEVLFRIEAEAGVSPVPTARAESRTGSPNRLWGI